MLERIHRTIKRYGLVKKNDTVYLALSGGKDSAAALCGLATYKEDFKLVCFHIDFGVSEKIVEAVKTQAERFGTEIRIIKPEDFGISIKNLKTPRPICSCCGVIKRYIMNRFPREEGATKIATGHHMDDFLVFFFKNLAGRNIEWISKFRPLVKGYGKILTKIRPLFEVDSSVTEKISNEFSIPYVTEDLCPHSVLRRERQVSRERWYRIINEIERIHPGFKINTIRSIIRISELVSSGWSPNECRECGEPTSADTCSFCRLKKSQA
ncbi:MAG: adenine nucleotide alpha hydrolase family protein [Candidatus Micrarchaeota archaeon]|nr:adenine nucleotide alpha hydrolase family protein [Candidatus Micrarchaeota archaeon]